MSEYPGRYARLEGLDGAGKTAQIQLAKEYAEEHDIDTVFVREPGGTELGTEIRHMLLTNKSHNLSAKTETLLFMADRNHTIETVILPGLKDGKVIIGDRGEESTKIYQVAGGMKKELIEGLSSLIYPIWYRRPDALALLSISRATREKRMAQRYKTEAADKMEEREREFFDRVFDGYVELEKEDYVTIIDAEPAPEVVFKSLIPILFGQFAKE